MRNHGKGLVRESSKSSRDISVMRSGRYTRSALRSIFYVLHAFKKKSKSGISTPRTDVELVRLRLKAAQLDYSALMASGEI